MGSTKIEQPAPPQIQSNTETAAQSIQAQIDAIPKILASQKEFAPQFQQLELDQFKQFGGQQTGAYLDLAEQFGGRLNELTRQEQLALAPERVAGSEAISKYLNDGPETLSQEEQDAMLEDVRAAQQTRGLAQSGMATVDELKKMTGLRQALKDRYLNIALSASGRLPAAGGSSVAAPNTASQQLVQNVDPATFFGGQNNVNNSKTSIFSSQASMYGSSSANQGGGIGGMVGSLAGGFLGSMAGPMGTAIGSKLGGQLAGGGK
jgi:hypothetical protein